MIKYNAEAHFIDLKGDNTFVSKGSIFETTEKRAKEINQNLASYAQELGIEAVLIPVETVTEKGV